MKLFLTISILVANILLIQAQQNINESCNFDPGMEEYYQQNPDELENYQERENLIQQIIAQQKKQQGKSKKRYIIPVVFHIFGTDWTNSSGQLNNPEVTDEIVKSSLAAVNQNFAGYNDPVDPYFSDIEGSMNIEFKLAQIDPNGNTTSGIMHYEERSGFALNGTKDEEIKRYAWDNFKYFNVYIQVQIKGSSRTNSGTAWLPSISMTQEGTARVVYNGRYLLYSPPASSLTHEFGHYLDLHHTFRQGCIEDDNAGDQVPDTPATESGTASIGGDSCATDITNCFNQRINYQNHMDYNPCESMFTKGQVARMLASLQDPARISLWQDENLEVTGVSRNLGPRVLFTYQDRLDDDSYKTIGFVEAPDNDGTILAKKKIKAIDGARFAASGKLTEGTHFGTEDLPDGIKVDINVFDQFTAEITVSGKATSHGSQESGAFKIKLLNPAIVGGVNSIFSDTGSYTINFLDPYVEYYQTFSPYMRAEHGLTSNTSDKTTGFNSISLGGNWTVSLSSQDGDRLVIDNRRGDYEVLCNPNSTNISYLAEAKDIKNASGDWVSDPGPAAFLPLLVGNTYNNWKGKTGYVGIRKTTLFGNKIYGWLKVQVSADGKQAFCNIFGANPEPGATMLTRIENPYLEYSYDRFVESDKDDKTLKNTITAKLNGDTFGSSGKFQNGVHYKANNVPSGTNIEVSVSNSSTAIISLKESLNDTGGGTNEWNVYRRDFSIEFLDNAFTNNKASSVEFAKFTPKVEYVGKSFSEEVSDVVLNIDKDDFSGSFFFMNSAHTIEGDKFSYALQYYKPLNGVRQTPGVKLITYRKDALANSNYELTPLDKGTLIDSNSSWKNGREFFSGSGQHLIDGETYKVWRGKTKYAGIRIRKSGQYHYGWLEISVSSNGKTSEIKSFGINGTPNKGIRAGTLESVDTDSGSCSDGIQNGDETGVDCGGSCSPCETTVDAGTVATTTNQTSVTTVTGDGVADVISFTKSGASQNSYRYLITDDSGNILTTEDSSHDFEGASLGICRVYGIAYTGSLSVSNKNVADSSLSSGEFDVSDNWITVTRVETGPTCDDGIQNGDETGVDCGGSCSPCSTGGDYCAVGIQGNNYIKNVTFGSINNPSDNRPYSDFTSISTTVQKGQSYPLSVGLGIESARWDKNNVGAWIDWNQDGDFEDANEFVLRKTSSPGGASGTVTVPDNAKSGTTRMRIRFNYHTMPQPCGTDRRSGDEAEDYTINVGGTNPPPPPPSGNVVYVDIEDQTANSANDWDFFRIEKGDDRDYGAWFGNNKIYFYSYKKAIVVGSNGSDKIELLPENHLVGPSSNFDNDPKRRYLVSSDSFDLWDGRSGYIGFTFKINNNTHYGWFHITISSNGKSFIVLDYAYNLEANAPLLTTREGAKTPPNPTIAEKLRSFPNPFSDYTTLSLSSFSPDKLTISVYNISGKLIKEKTFEENPGALRIGESVRDPGVYFVKVLNNKTLKTIKITKK